ncbi:MAG: OmpA family protein [Gammaproteobacteria bacterium]|nr:OmpA family protein [Gammaproteobacteria bacterium]
MTGAQPETPGGTHDEDLARLRELVLGLDPNELFAVVRAFADPQLRTRAMSEVLTEALRRRNEADGSVGMALGPTIEDALRSSIRRDPAPLAEAIYPVIGPSIRKAINAAIMDMVESLNRAVNDQLSWQALRWRIAAWRAGVPYSEYLLINNVAYRIEQVFVIHKETGLLLQHVAATDEAVSDPDMVSGMLSAIQEFIRDSFDSGGNGDSSSDLRSMRTGSRTVVIEPGRHAIAAMVVNGVPPAEKTALLADLVDRLHSGWGAMLASFDGDTAPFSSLRDLFQPLMMRSADISRTAADEAAGRRRWPLLLGAVLVLAVVAMWQWQGHQHRAQVAALQQALGAEPGLVITRVQESGGVVRVAGLRDALARDPEEVAGAWPKLEVAFDFKPYFAAEPGLAAARIEQLLTPPAGASVRIEGSEVEVSGEIDRPWVERARGVLQTLPGNWSLSLGDVHWQVTPEEQRQALVRTIEEERIYFELASAELSAEAIARIRALAARINELLTLAPEPPTLIVYGQSDFTGPRDLNRVLSERRSAAVREVLIDAGVAPEMLVSEGIISADDTPSARQVRLAVRW